MPVLTLLGFSLSAGNGGRPASCGDHSLKLKGFVGYSHCRSSCQQRSHGCSPPHLKCRRRQLAQESFVLDAVPLLERLMNIWVSSGERKILRWNFDRVKMDGGVEH